MMHALKEDRLVAVGRSEGGGRREVAGKETARRGSPVARSLCRFRLALALALAVGAFGPQLTAQVLEPLSPSELVFGEEINVRVVNRGRGRGPRGEPCPGVESGRLPDPR